MPTERFDDRIVLRHPKGSSVEILYYGATIISWKSGSTNPGSDSEVIERLFTSAKAATDGSKPVRGGVPVIFPCFGAPTHPDHTQLNQHGFARNEVWSWDDVVMDNEAGVSIRLTLQPTPKIAAVYNRSFLLSYVVTLAEHQLSTDLHVKNTSTSPAFPPDSLEFQALFHNYIRAPAQEVLVTPLQHLEYFDKTEATDAGRATVKIETRAGVDVRRFTDSVYDNAPQKYEVIWPGGGISIKTTNLKNVVVWNPQEENGSKIGDMEDGGWERFICVEPGFVRGFVKLEPGHTWIGQQVLSPIHEERRVGKI